MRVVVIAPDYPPAPASGAQRAGAAVRTLRAAGFDVRVVTAQLETPDGVERVGPREGAPHVRVVAMRASGADLLAAVGRLAARIRRRPGRAAGVSVRAEPDILDPGPRFRRWATAILRFPDGHLGFLRSALQAAVVAGSDADVLYTTGPPVTAHLVGLLARAMTGVPWIAEYRDPWIVDRRPLRPPSVRSALTDALERWLETRCLAAAAEVVAVSDGIADTVAPRRLGLQRPLPHVVRNGIPSLDADPAPRSEGALRILHLGNLYAFRDPRPFLAALAGLRAERDLGPDDVSVRFVGDAPPDSIRSYIEAQGLTDLVRFEGWVAHDIGQALVRDSDVLLLLAQRQPLQVPNKLYEYLGSRRPILAFADGMGETHAMLERVGGHTVITENDGVDAVRASLGSLLDRGSPDPIGDPRVLEEWTSARQLALLPELFRKAERR